ncbi:MAG: hypothetical protein M5U19_03775 [Microthrixaceae bacterium]|nr:hypothetical protein [Microthrixaceae bacterium]
MTEQDTSELNAANGFDDPGAMADEESAAGAPLPDDSATDLTATGGTVADEPVTDGGTATDDTTAADPVAGTASAEDSDADTDSYVGGDEEDSAPAAPVDSPGRVRASGTCFTPSPGTRTRCVRTWRHAPAP